MARRITSQLLSLVAQQCVGTNAVTSTVHQLTVLAVLADDVVDPAIRTVTPARGATAHQADAIPNMQQDHPELPLTGTNGELLLTIGDVALLVAGGAFMAARRRSGDQP